MTTTPTSPSAIPFDGLARRRAGTSRGSNPGFFRHLERRIGQLGELGIEADLILFHPYDRLGLRRHGPAADDRYLRYVVARLAAFRNVWWSLANEYDLMRTRTRPTGTALPDRRASDDPYGHLRSIHNCRALFDHNEPVGDAREHAERVDVDKTAENADEWLYRDVGANPS